MRNAVTSARTGLLALAILLMRSVWASPTAAHQGDVTAPTPVAVNVEFGDNACVGNDYTEPAMDAPQFPGTAQAITGTVAPGSTVQVAYTALEGFVIEGQHIFTHTYPAEPSSATDCEKAEQPEPQVRHRFAVRTDCDGVERRDWQVVTPYVWDESEWVLGEPEVRNDTGWVFLRALTPAEHKQLGCLEVVDDQEDEPDDETENGGAPAAGVTPAEEAVSATAPTAVPTMVDAGLSDPVAAPAGPRWLVPLLGGVLMLGLAGFWRPARGRPSSALLE